jgi:hypothetical protein
MTRWYPTAAGGTRTRAAMRFRLSPSRYVSTHSVSGAGRNRLSMMDPIPPRPSPRRAGTAAPRTLLSVVRWRGRLWGPVLSVAGLRPSLALSCLPRRCSYMIIGAGTLPPPTRWPAAASPTVTGEDKGSGAGAEGREAASDPSVPNSMTLQPVPKLRAGGWKNPARRLPLPGLRRRLGAQHACGPISRRQGTSR